MYNTAAVPARKKGAYHVTKENIAF